MPLLPYSKPDRIEAGIDEAGRGCLFGRVYIAAVVWPHKVAIDPPYEIKDSKKVTARRRAILRKYIEENAVSYCVAYLEHSEIDDLNILQATLAGMHKALDGLETRPHYILVDGDRFKPYKDIETGRYIQHECVKGGDNTYLSIAAASILAKEYRDEYIKNLCEAEPELKRYGLIKNKGYGTEEHRKAIAEHGVSSYHRLSFGICRQFSKGRFDKPREAPAPQPRPRQVKLGNVFATLGKNGK